MNKGYIYKIVINNQDMIYIGSTKDLNQRKRTHKSNCFRVNGKKYNLNVYKIIRDKGITRDNFNEMVDIVWIEDVNYNERHELTAREKHYIMELKPCGNMKIPYDKCKEEYQKEYRENNKDKNKEYKTEYREKNKDKIKEKDREYQKKNYEKNKEKKKEYYEKNKDKIKEYQKKYQKKYREKARLKKSNQNS